MYSKAAHYSIKSEDKKLLHSGGRWVEEEELW